MTVGEGHRPWAWIVGAPLTRPAFPIRENHLHLRIDWDVAKSLAIRIESAEPRSLQSTDRGKIARGEFFALGKFRESGEDFVAFGKKSSKNRDPLSHTAKRWIVERTFS